MNWGPLAGLEPNCSITRWDPEVILTRLSSHRQAVILSPSTAGARAPVFLDIGLNRSGQLDDIGVAPGAYAGTVYKVAQAALDRAVPLWQDAAFVQAPQFPSLGQEKWPSRIKPRRMTNRQSAWTPGAAPCPLAR